MSSSSHRLYLPSAYGNWPRGDAQRRTHIYRVDKGCGCPETGRLFLLGVEILVRVFGLTHMCVPAGRRMSVYEREECVRAGGP